MPTTFANTIDNNPIYADRAEKDAAGNSIQTTYATKSEVNTGLASKQDTISDLSTIRSGAAAGATAVQPGDLATVATTGDYNDLSNKPTIPAAQVNSDWNASSGVAEILNKPTLATVATTGDYDDLSNKPTIPAAQVNSDWNASSGVAEILNKPTIRNVPASTASDADKVLTVDSNGDAVWMSPSYGLFEAIYGQTSYSDIVAAINAHKIVYCRISATGASRMAFLAYIGTSNVEFQYYRSLNSHSASNQTDEVYVYTVSSTGWTTTTRLTGIKYAAGTHMTSSFANNTLTFQSVWPDVDQTYDATSANAQSGVAIAGALATKEDSFDVGTGLEMDTTGATPTLQVDETVLWEGTLSTTSTTVTLAEATNNFEKIKVYVQSNGYNVQSTVVHELVLNYRTAFNNDAVAFVIASEIHSSITTQCTLYLHFTGAFGTGFKLENGSKWVGSTLTENISSFPCIVTKIVGVNRIASN